MTTEYIFDINKYIGTWYELAHYPSWFQRNDNYNTTAEYTIMKENVIQVHNSTITNGKTINSFGIGRYLGGNKFRVDFPHDEANKLIESGEFVKFQQNLDCNQPNYIVEKLWLNCYGQYVFAVVTDPSRQSFYLLSRYRHPSLIAYTQVMEYVIANFDRDRLVQSPYFNSV